MNTNYVVMVSAGALLIVTGVVVFVSRQNWAIGIRTPWGLENEKAWEVSNKIGGATLIASGVVLMLSSTGIADVTWAVWTLLGGIIASTAAAYLVWRRSA